MSNLTKSDSPVKTIKMNQSLVHIKHSITIRQYKYWYLMLKFHAEKLEQGIQPDENGYYFESRSKFAEYIGYDMKTAELKIEIEALRKESIIINYLEKDGKPAIRGMGFISEWDITSNRIGYKLPTFLEKVLQGDDESKKMFLLLKWDIFNSFTGKYEAIIYKLCKDYVGVGRTPYFTIEEYREYIGLKKEEYKQFFELNRWTLKKPLEAINKSEISDLKITVEFNKSGRSTVGLYFKVEHKKQSNLPFEELQPCDAFAFAKVPISMNYQKKYMEMYSEEQIVATIERANTYIEELKEKGSGKINMGAIYTKAFKDNWGEQLLEEKRLKQAEEEKRQHRLEQEQKKKAQEEEQEQQRLEKNSALLIEFDSFTDELKEKLIGLVISKNPVTAKPIKDALAQYGFDAYKHHNMFKGLLMNVINEYKRGEFQSALINNFENLPSNEKMKEIDFLIHVNRGDKKLFNLLNSAYKEHGIHAHKYNEEFYSCLMMHLNMKEATANVDD